MAEKKVRLTKKRLARMYEAITVDDVMREHFRRLNADLDRRGQRIAQSEQVIQVLKREGGKRAKPKIYAEMMIAAVHRTSAGVIVEVY